MSPSDDPELMLAAACCRWPPTSARTAAIHAAAGRVRDWPRFARVVKRQRVAGLVHEATHTLGLELPRDVAQLIAQEASGITRRNLLATAETARLIRLIAGAGFPVLAVKGVTLGMLVYGSLGLKHSKDIDLLILPEHAAAVIALLEADTYRLTFPAAHLTQAQRAILPRYCKDVAMVRDAGYLQLELHWRLFVNTALVPGITARSASQPVSFSPSNDAPTLATPILYAYLAQHGATDGWSRLKWLADVAALLAPLDPATIATLHDEAARQGAEIASLQTLTMVHDLFGVRVPPLLLEAAQHSWRVRTLITMAYRLMTPRDGETETPNWWRGQMLLLLMQPLVARGVSHKWQILHSTLYIQADMFSSSAPPSLYVLYPLLRLPIWVARKLDTIMRAVAPRGKRPAGGGAKL